MDKLKEKFNSLTKNQKYAVIAGVIVLVVILFSIGKSAMQPTQLEGSYTGKIGSGFLASKDTLVFDGNTVTEKRGSVSNTKSKSTYKLDGNKITFKFADGSEGYATLSDDGKSFTITGATGLEALATGVTFTKDNQ